MKVIVLGANGMIGHAMFRGLRKYSDLDVYGTVRSAGAVRHFDVLEKEALHVGINVLDTDALVKLLRTLEPDVIVNCVGLINKFASSKDPVQALPVNAIFPHRLARICDLAGVRVVHISTDCVFSGAKGNYLETDLTDAKEMYGVSKAIGELRDYQNALTIRTSAIGHEFDSNNELLGWFLSQKGPVKGYAGAIYSGLTTVELPRVVAEYVLPNQALCGLYNVSATPISKYDLLVKIAAVYGKIIDVVPDHSVSVDRTLDSSRFRYTTGFHPRTWDELIQVMFNDHTSNSGANNV
jgi:dTDP-4-dehydrorhamnose reductase